MVDPAELNILPLVVRRSRLRLINLFPSGNFADFDVTLPTARKLDTGKPTDVE